MDLVILVRLPHRTVVEVSQNVDRWDRRARKEGSNRSERDTFVEGSKLERGRYCESTTNWKWDRHA